MSVELREYDFHKEIIERDNQIMFNEFSCSESLVSVSKNLQIPIQVKRPAADTLQSFAKKRRLEETQLQKGKEQFAAMLDVPKEASVTVDIRSLSEALSREKNAAIEAKRLAKKRTTIKGTDDIGLGSDLCVMSDSDAGATKDIMFRERQWRTRTTVLQSTVKVFEEKIFTILQSVRDRDERGHRHRPTQR